MTGVNIVEGIATLSRRAVLNASVKAPFGKKLAEMFPRPSDVPETQPDYDRRFDVNPKWFPDGQKILFRSNAFSPDEWTMQVWVMDPDGGNKTRLTTGGDFTDAIWGPDGNTFVYVNRIFGKTAIWNMDLTSGDQKPIFHREGRVPYHPVVSPDGRRLTFALGKADPRGYAYYEGNEIWSLDIDRRKAGKLIDQEFVNLGKLHWSKDGKYLAIEEHGDFIGAVWVYDDRGKKVRKVVEEGVERVTWSPARDHVLTLPYKKPGEQSINLWSYDVDHDKFWPWPSARHNEATYPVWSLEGYGIAYLVLNSETEPGTWTMELRLEKLGRTLRFPYKRLQLFSPFDFQWNSRGELVFSASPPDVGYPEDAKRAHIFKVTADDQLVQLTDKTILK